MYEVNVGNGLVYHKKIVTLMQQLVHNVIEVKRKIKDCCQQLKYILREGTMETYNSTVSTSFLLSKSAFLRKPAASQEYHEERLKKSSNRLVNLRTSNAEISPSEERIQGKDKTSGSCDKT